MDCYGDAGPLIPRTRVVALLGSELVEGEISGGRVQVIRRANVAPRPVEVDSQ